MLHVSGVDGSTSSCALAPRFGVWLQVTKVGRGALWLKQPLSVVLDEIIEAFVALSIISKSNNVSTVSESVNEEREKRRRDLWVARVEVVSSTSRYSTRRLPVKKVDGTST